jgi:arabinose-5-phosphate isomerase
VRGFTAQDFVRFHPGGRLGRKLTLVSSLMHAGAGLPRVRQDVPMKEAVAEMSSKRLGMTCVVDERERLVGVLTDGDLRRRLIDAADPLDGTASDGMTGSPATIAAGALATEALRLMEERKITSLPVVDEEHKLLGVIQIHDLWRTELF